MYAIDNSVLRNTSITTSVNNTKSKPLLSGGNDRANVQIGKASYGASKTGASFSLTGVDINLSSRNGLLFNYKTGYAEVSAGLNIGRGNGISAKVGGEITYKSATLEKSFNIGGYTVAIGGKAYVGSIGAHAEIGAMYKDTTNKYHLFKLGAGLSDGYGAGAYIDIRK
ncbi:hypothetical protein [Caloramator proteoclasticus]|uniref:Uncharacterized protein n=1 Tax=Caloramator proteoclasticus DSM 10124 TaxID=1121262 RepID=A0A1M4X8F3_9CLOT|nr:hypothetical protein [Caloramator proteoclasticus]SHE89675.1 hypothetical protein SAMN02746091_01342 [Caloramator proteoclasticus DSM 10124]